MRPIDSVNVWPMLTGLNVSQPRVLTPTTEASIVEATPDTWWKLVTLGGQSNYYTKNASQTKGNDECLAGRQPDPPQPGRTDAIVNGCPVCNATSPCLYDLRVDPSERRNVASQHPDVVTRLMLPLNESNNHYVTGHLPAVELENKYIKVGKDAWGKFKGPCYKRKRRYRDGM